MPSIPQPRIDRQIVILLLIGQHFARVVKMRKISCLCILLCAGCVSVNSTVLRDRSTTPHPPNQVNVALADDEIDESCERVALLHASGNEDFTDESEMLTKLREEAGKLGANLVHLQSMEDPGTGERVLGALFGTSVDRDSEAIAYYCPDGAF